MWKRPGLLSSDLPLLELISDSPCSLPGVEQGLCVPASSTLGFLFYNTHSSL